MAEQQHETLVHLIKTWRVANESVERDPDNKSATTNRDKILKELETKIVGSWHSASAASSTIPLVTALSQIDIQNRPDAKVLADVRALVNLGPFPAVDGDNWAPEGGWPERKWLIPAWLPLGRLGLLSGRGGRGKSRLALQLAARVAARPPRPGGFIRPKTPEDLSAITVLPQLSGESCGPVVYVSWEDEREEAGRRLKALRDDGLGNLKDELRGRLRFVDLRGAGPLWAPADGSGRIHAVGTLTHVGRRVRETAEDMDARLLVVDSLAGAYAGDENVRAFVRAFCSDWDAWATRAQCTVMLIAHPPKTPSGAGASTADRDYAGSTDWHAAARWRWTLDSTAVGESKVDALALACAKSSYGPNPGRLFLSPSKTRVGWEALTEQHAAENALRADG